MFSPTFIIGNSARCWNTILTLRLLGGVPSTERPLMRMSPEASSSKPAIMRIRVVLPQPDGPRIEKNDPLAISNETSSTAVNGPNRLERFSHSRSLVMAARKTAGGAEAPRSEEHTSELQSLMRISYAVFCLKKKNKENTQKVSTTDEIHHRARTTE